MAGGYRMRRRLAAGGLLSSLLLVSACDRQEERADNARGLIEAAIDQVTGDKPPTDPRSMMARVDMADRALAGVIQEATDAPVVPASSRFVVGSIIAKPKEFAVLEARSLPSVQAPAIVDRQDEAASEEASVDESGLEAAAPSPPTFRDLREKALARREALDGWKVEVQADARTKMLDTMEKLGVDGTVQASRSGQMIINFWELGVDPTQGRPSRVRDRLAQLRERSWAENVPRECPDTPSRDTMRSDPVLATECLIKSLRDSSEFEYVEKDFIFDHQFARRPRIPTFGEVATTPDDPLWSLQWHFQSNGDGEGEAPGGAGFVDFWTQRSNQGSPNVVVAVVDTGLQLDHPDIATSANVAPGWDMVADPEVGNDGDGRDPDPNDPGDLCDPNDPFAEDTFHGTHVAGTIGAAATNNEAGVAGGAWAVKIVPVRALGKCGGRLSDINDAIRWAGGLIPAIDDEGREVWNENPADIINLSIGLFEFCPASLQDAIDSVTERGVVVVSAAGNAQVSTRFYAPGGCNNVITAAAGDLRGHLAPYSNFGDEVDVLAPGGDLSRDDNGDGRPDGVLSTKLADNCLDPLSNEPIASCYYAYEQGTSMSAPHVSAALALIKSADPALTGPELRATLLGSLDRRDAAQCARPCSDVASGGTPIEGDETMCALPCGGLLNLANLAE